MFAVTVTFKIKAGHWDGFLPLMRDNARTSLREEPACRHFDVCTEPERAHEVFLYELYDNAAAFQDHLKSDHFRTFDAAVAAMIESKHIATYGTVE